MSATANTPYPPKDLPADHDLFSDASFPSGWWIAPGALIGMGLWFWALATALRWLPWL